MQQIFSKLKRNELNQLVYIGLVLFLVATENGFGLITFQSLFLDKIGSAYLPYAFIADVVFSLIGIFIYIKFLKRFSQSLLFIAINLILSILLVIAYFFISLANTQAASDPWLISSFVLQIAIHALTITVLASSTWDFINRLFRPVLLKKYIHVFVLISIGAELFSAALAKIFGLLLSAQPLLLIWASIYVFCAFAYYFKYGLGVYGSFKKIEKSEHELSTMDGIRYLKFNKLAIILLTISFLYYLSQEFVYFQMAVAAGDRYASGNEIAQFYGSLQFFIYSAVMLALLVFQNRAVSHIGLFRSMAIVPLVIVIGSSILLWSFGFTEIAVFWGIILFLMCVTYEPAQQCTFGMIDPKWRGIIIALSELFKLAGAAAAGIILLIGDNQTMWWISLAALIGAALQLITIWMGSRVYLRTLLSNLSDKKMQFTSLESIEDIHDTSINKELLRLLLDTGNKTTVDTKVKVLDTIKRLGNPLFLRALAILVKHPRSDIRAESISAANELLKTNNKNVFIERYFIKKMREFVLGENSLTVKAQAIEFLFDHSSRDNILQLVKEFSSQKDTKFKISALRALRSSNLHFKDFLEIDILDDPDPEVKAEAIIDLWKFDEYKQISQKEVEKLLRTPTAREKQAALRVLALTLIPIEADAKGEVVRALYGSATNESKLYALLYRLRELNKESPQREQCFNEVLETAAACFGSSEEKWRDFLQELLSMDDDPFLYELLDKIIDFALAHPEISPGMRQIADIMNTNLESTPFIGRKQL